MTALLAAEDYEPAEGLHPIAQQHVPFRVGENVAFREDHDKFGGVEATAEDHAMYGQIKAIGIDDSGSIALDLLVYDPHTGVTGDETEIHRATLEQLQ